MIADPTTLPFLLTAEEVADLLRISPKAVYQRIARGQMPGVVRKSRRVLVVRDVLLRAIAKGVNG